MEQEIIFKAIIEVLGKPKEHVEKAIKDYVNNLRKNSNFTILEEDFAQTEPSEETQLWATFVELELKTNSFKHLTGFCFDYMPSVLEIITPTNLTFSDKDVSTILNDLQAKLHQVDMVAKQLQNENNILNHSLGALLKNYITLILTNQNLTSDQISKLTGVAVDKLEDFLDQLIDEGRIDLKEGIYWLKKEVLA